MNLNKVILNDKEARKKGMKNEKGLGPTVVGRAAERCLFTGAIRLLPNTETFACCVSALGRFVPP